MNYRNLGHSGLRVSPICLGAMMFGHRSDEATAKRIVDRARDAGINFIDTADAYAKGVSEEITGRAIAEQGQESAGKGSDNLAMPHGTYFISDVQIYQSAISPGAIVAITGWKFKIC